MATPFARLEEELACPVCHDTFKHPVVLSCSHSFCKGCLQEWWTGRREQECPVCKKRRKKQPPPTTNLVLKNLCEKYLEEKRRSGTSPEDLCAAHGEKLVLFCQDDEQLACVMCVCDKEKHAIRHKFLSVDEVSGQFKENVQESLKSLKEKLEVFSKVMTTCDQTGDHIKLQAQTTEVRIEAQFKALRQFLKNEQSARISALRREEAQKRRKVTERIDELNMDMASLSDAIRAAEDLLKAADDRVSFLRKYKATMERVRLTLLDPRPLSGPLIDEAQHLGNLAFRVWDKMKDIVSYTPVIFDPNTACPKFIPSGDLTSVRLNALKTQQLPDNEERFDASCRVLGSEGFSSGVHSWDVEVGDWGHWGVLPESYQRKGHAVSGDFWRLEKYFHNNFYAAVHSSGSTHGSVVLTLKHSPRRIRVRLDWARGTLCFSDPDAETHLHTFHHTFTERLFPCVGILRHHNTSLKMLPSKICVSLENC